MNEFRELWGGVPVPLEARVEKGDWNSQPATRSFRPDINGSVWGMKPGLDQLRRLTRMFVQEQRRRVSGQTECDSGETTEILWRRMTVAGRVTIRKDSHIGQRKKYWDDRDVPGSVLRAVRIPKEVQTEFHELNLEDEGDGIRTEEVDWASLERANGDLEPPTVALMISLQSRQ